MKSIITGGAGFIGSNLADRLRKKGHKVIILDDKWTVVTRDGKKSAHFEHSVAITENGPEILSLGI